MDKATVDVIVEVFVKVGFPSIVAGYFLYRDFRQSERQIQANEKIAANLAVLNDNFAHGDRQP